MTPEPEKLIKTDTSNTQEQLTWLDQLLGGEEKRMNGYHCLNCGEKLKQISMSQCTSFKIINDIKKGGE